MNRLDVYLLIVLWLMLFFPGLGGAILGLGVNLWSFLFCVLCYAGALSCVFIRDYYRNQNNSVIIAERLIQEMNDLKQQGFSLEIAKRPDESGNDTVIFIVSPIQFAGVERK